ncbi:MAG: hypothetical protein NZ992_00115 [Candidatus Korarchaeum sp.]|nr:hypothetical protein [Candidatus Korarchaeum sp.]
MSSLNNPLLLSTYPCDLRKAYSHAKSIDELIILSLNPNTPSDVLEKIIERDCEASKYALTNPSLSKEAMIRYAREGEHRVIFNPSADEDVLETVFHCAPLYRCEILNRPILTPRILCLFTRHPRADLRIEAVLHPSANAEVLWAFAEDPSAEVRATVARRAAELGITELEEYILSLPEELWAKKEVLAHTNNVELIREYAERIRHSDGDSGLRIAIASNPNTPPEILSGLVDEDFCGIRARVAEHPSTPPETLSRLAGDENEEVRAAVASNPNTPEETLDWLWANRTPRINLGLAMNAKLPQPRLELLLALAEEYLDVELLLSLASNPSLSSEQLRRVLDAAFKARKEVREELKEYDAYMSYGGIPGWYTDVMGLTEFIFEVILNHPNVTKEMVEEIAATGILEIEKAAQKRLKEMESVR